MVGDICFYHMIYSPAQYSLQILRISCSSFSQDFYWISVDTDGPVLISVHQILLKVTYPELSNKIIFPIMTRKGTVYLLRNKKFFYAKSSLATMKLNHPYFPSNVFWVLLIACRKT